MVECGSIVMKKIDSLNGYIRVSQRIKCAKYQAVQSFVRISNLRNSVNFCSIFPGAKDSPWNPQKNQPVLRRALEGPILAQLDFLLDIFI